LQNHVGIKEGIVAQYIGTITFRPGFIIAAALKTRFTEPQRGKDNFLRFQVVY
jgi:hypothetical protein